MSLRLARILCLSMLCLTPAWDQAAEAAPVPLTILHTNDTHDHLEAFDTRHGKGLGGIARRASLIRQVKKENPATLVLDAGDVFQGTPLFNFFSGEPDFITMKQAGYDAMAVGNHDLDNGIQNLLTQSRHLDHPPLAINLYDPKGQRYFPTHRIFERGGLKIAVVGALGRNAFEAVAAPRRAGITFKDPEPELKHLVQRLRSQVDLVVLLTHIGHEEEVSLAKAMPDVDLIVGGHSHTKVEKPVVVKHAKRDTLVAQAFQWGEFMGRIDLQVEGGRIVRHEGRLLTVGTEIPEDPTVAATVAHYAKQIATQMQEVVGRTAIEFSNSRKREGDTPIGNLVADAVKEETGAQVAFMNSGGIRAPLPQGDITRGMVFSMLPFENTLVTFTCTGVQLQAILDFAASRNGKSGSLQVAGLQYEVDGERARAVQVEGKALEPGAVYRVATIDYVAQGNDGADVFRSVSEVVNTGTLVRDAFMRFMKKRAGAVEAPSGGRIRKRTPATAS
ncbi:MAG: 5'-nucleotidase C-terminal domain-containing protein [Candidatus Sericytochromatia bacterium]|nr:5'-nucleotidase C-terminal domain-containing protein [Candidatus Sericytochromatia bacterium]